MKRIILISFLFVSFFAKAQQYTNFQGYGFKATRMWADSVSIQPSDTIKNKVAKSIAILNNKLYVADGTKWILAGGGAVDTFLLSTRAWRQKGIDSVSANVNFRVKYTDTALMLLPYLRKADTISLSDRIDARVKYTDTASMLSPYSKLKSVGLSMPSAFNVANSPLTSNGTIAVSGAGTAAQYVRGDGQLATFPSTGGGGSSVYYYLNGSVASGVGTYKQMANTAVIGAGTDFTLTGNGLIAQFLTDAGNPNRIQIPGGAWNFEMFFSVSSGGGNQKFYVELYKYNGSTFTLISSGSTNPEEITGGTTTDLYLTSLAVPTTTLLTTDRLAIRVYIVDNAIGRTITLHTEDNNLCQILTTFAGGISSLNGLTANTQYFATGTSGTDFNISSSTDTHTFNIPSASINARGLMTTDTQTFAGAKTFNGSIKLPNFVPLDLSNGARVEGYSGKVLFRTVSGTAGYFENNSLYLAAMDNEPNTSNIGVLVKRFDNESKVSYKTPAQMMTYLGALGTTDTATMLNPYTRGSGTSGQVAYWNDTRSLTGSSTFAFTPSSQLLVNNSVTAASAIARGTNLTPTLTAAANNDVLVGLDINPTFTNGAFTGTRNLGLRVGSLFNVDVANQSLNIISESGALANRGIAVYQNNTGQSGAAMQFLKSRGTNASPTAVTSGDIIGAFVFKPYIGSSYTLDRSLFGANMATSTGVGMFFIAGSTDGNYIPSLYIHPTSNVVIGSTQSILTGITDAGFRLDVNGTARIQGNTLINTTYSTPANNAGNLRILTTNAQTTNVGGSLGLGGNGANANLTFALLQSGSETGFGDRGYFSLYTNGTGISSGFVERLRVTSNGTLSLNHSKDNTASTVPLAVYGSASQSANLTSWFNSGNSLLAYVAANGLLGTSASITASSGLAQGVSFANTLVAAANNDVLVGLDINPTFTNGAFTGLQNYGLRLQGQGNDILRINTGISTTSSSSITVAENWGPSFNGIYLAYFNNSYTTSGFRRANAGVISTTGSGGLNIVSDASGASIRFHNKSGININQQISEFFATGNLLLQTGGTFTDAGFKLDVNGTARVQTTLDVNTGSGVAATGNNLPVVINSNFYGNGDGFVIASKNSSTGSPNLTLRPNSSGANSLKIYNDGNVSVLRQTNTSGVGGASVYLFQIDNRVAKFGVSSDISTADASFYGKAIWDGGAAAIFRGSSTTQSAAIFRVQNFDATSEFLQVSSIGSIGINTSSINASAQLQIESTTRGFLPPRMTTTQQNAISSPAAGLLLVDNTVATNNILRLNNGTGWGSILSSNPTVTASAGAASGFTYTPSLTAAANNDVLVGLDVNPTFTNGAFTGLQNHAARIQGNTVIGATTYSTMLYSAIPKLFVNGGTYLNSTVLIGTNSIQFSGNNVTWENTGITNNLPEWRADATGVKFGNYLSLPLRLSVGGTENARFFSTGNVAIGTTTDAGFKLDVNGTARVQSGTTGTTPVLTVTNTSSGNFTFLVNNSGTGNTNFGMQINGTTKASIGYSRSGDFLGFFVDGATPNYFLGQYNIDGSFQKNRTSDGNADFKVFNGGGTIIGAATLNASAQLQVESTTKGFLPPRMTTAQRDLIATPAAGLVIYNTSTNKHQGYDGTNWNDFY